MSKRNFTLVIIILIIIAVVAFGIFYFYKSPSTPGDPGEGTNFFSNFNPFSKKKTTTPDEEIPTDISGYEPSTGEETIMKLRKISSMPVAGYGVFLKERYKEVAEVIPPITTEVTEGEKPAVKEPVKKPTPPATEFITALRYMDRVTGNIYQTFADKINERKFSSSVIPKVYEATFGDKGESVVARYLLPDNITIQSFTGTLPKELLGADGTDANELKGSFLPTNIKDVSISSDLKNIFYLFEAGEGIVGVTAGIAGDKKVQVFSSPFTEWLSQWPNSNLITLTTKPSSGIPGYMYAVNPSKKDFTKVLGGINGLTTLTSPDGKSVLYGDSNLSLSVYNTSTKNAQSLGVRTLPEKCVWSGASDVVFCAVPRFQVGGSYPDSWYKGDISFSDDIWKIDIKSGTTLLLSEPIAVTGEEVDGIKLILDKEGNYLFFVNKKDSYLWGLDLR